MEGEAIQAMRNVMTNYDKIRGLSKLELGDAFWDLVVVTGSDEEQRQAYEQQIQQKLERHEIPSGLPYLVYADPPGPKSGCGVSTMLVIDELEKKFGEKLKTWRVLLLNAGGQSKRLPSASVLGKIFTPWPVASVPMYQTLDMKLACYLPFLSRMAPGYFHAPSDTLEVYDLGTDTDWDFERPGFTAVAHPSTLSIGTGHGVYVLEEKKKKYKKTWTEMRECLEVLQKPSIQRMEERGAIQQDGPEQEPWVYTDSSFFFDHSIADKLVKYYRENQPFECEIDGYGDFLQALGPRATIDYTQDLSNVTNVEPKLVKTREQIFHLLKGSPLHVFVLHVSKFYHLGTMGEYMEHFCHGDAISQEIGLGKMIFSSWEKCSNDMLKDKEDKLGQHVKGCIMHSNLDSKSSLPASSIVEYCNITIPLLLGDKCIISNCEINSGDLKVISVPDNMFIHTLPFRQQGQTKYVTIFCSTKDNVKKVKPFAEARNLSFLDGSMGTFCDKMDMKMESIFPKMSNCSLWSAKLFPALDTMSESFIATLKMLQTSFGNNNNKTLLQTLHGTVFSLEDVILSKDITNILEFRSKLYKKIKSSL